MVSFGFTRTPERSKLKFFNFITCAFRTFRRLYLSGNRNELPTTTHPTTKCQLIPRAFLGGKLKYLFHFDSSWSFHRKLEEVTDGYLFVPLEALKKPRHDRLANDGTAVRQPIVDESQDILEGDVHETRHQDNDLGFDRGCLYCGNDAQTIHPLKSPEPAQITIRREIDYEPQVLQGVAEKRCHRVTGALASSPDKSISLFRASPFNERLENGEHIGVIFANR